MDLIVSVYEFTDILSVKPSCYFSFFNTFVAFKGSVFLRINLRYKYGGLGLLF